MLDITGAGAQLPMRSHWKLRPGPQSHKNSERQCKRIRASTATANSKASATALKQLSSHRHTYRSVAALKTAFHPTTTLNFCGPGHQPTAGALQHGVVVFSFRVGRVAALRFDCDCAAFPCPDCGTYRCAFLDTEFAAKWSAKWSAEFSADDGCE